MKKIDYIAITFIALTAWILLKDSEVPKKDGKPGTGTPANSSKQIPTAQEKIQKDQQSVLKNLEGQLDQFAAGLAEDISEKSEAPAGAVGFRDGVPEQYAPKSSAPYSTSEKLEDDLSFRVKKFRHDSEQVEKDFANSREETGKDKEEYKALINKHRAQRAQMLNRHKELSVEFEKENQESSSKRLR